MIGTGGGVDSAGKTTLTKKFFVTKSAELNTAPLLTGYSATQIAFTKINETAYEQTINYAAQTDAYGVGTTVYEQNGVRGNFEMFCSFESKAIELHPRIDKLTKDFGGYYIDSDPPRAAWPPTYIPLGSGGLGGGKGIRNPMFGMTHWKEITLTLRHTYYTKIINQAIWDTSGKVVDSLPAGIPIPKPEKDKDGKEIPRRWMMQAPAVSRQGDAWQVVHEYVMMDSRGVADGLYAKGTLPGSQ
jgi:hypothetical protein